MKNYFFYVLISAALVISACKKGPGEGGSSHIKGKVLLLDYNGNYPVLDTSYYKEDEEVFIIYGDGAIYNDKFKTSYNGGYEFRYLRKGTYKVFTYSDDSTGVSPSGKIIVKQTVEIDKNNETFEVPDLVIVKN